MQNLIHNVICANWSHDLSILTFLIIHILTNALFWLFFLTSPNLAFLGLSDKNWPSIHKHWSRSEFLDSMESLKCVLSAENVFELRKWVTCAENQILQEKSVSLEIYYCTSLVNTKMVWGTPKYHPRLMKFESVVQLFMGNQKISRKNTLLDFWHCGPPYITSS